MLLRQIPLQITVFGKERLRNVLNASQRRVNKNTLTWRYVLKMSWRYLCKTSWRCLEDVFKTSWRRLEDVLKTYGQDEYIGHDQDVLKTFSRRLLETKTKDVFIKTNVCWVTTICFIIKFIKFEGSLLRFTYFFKD